MAEQLSKEEIVKALKDKVGEVASVQAAQKTAEETASAGGLPPETMQLLNQFLGPFLSNLGSDAGKAVAKAIGARKEKRSVPSSKVPSYSKEGKPKLDAKSPKPAVEQMATGVDSEETGGFDFDPDRIFTILEALPDDLTIGELKEGVDLDEIKKEMEDLNL